MTTHQTRLGYLLTFVVVLAFGVYPSVAPVGISSGASPLGFVLAAMVCSLLGVSVVAVAQGHALAPERSQVPARLLLGLNFFLEHVCLLFALNYLEVPVAMCLIYTYPFMVGAAAVVTGRHREAGSLLSTLILCLVGITMVLGFSASQFSLLGISFALAQALLATARILLTAKLVVGVQGIVLTTQMLAVGTLFGGITALVTQPSFPQDALGWGSVVLAGLSGMVGHGCLALALQRISPAPFAVIMNLEPVTTAILAAVFIGQVLMPIQYVGAALVVAAVIWYARSKMVAEAM